MKPHDINLKGGGIFGTNQEEYDFAQKEKMLDLDLFSRGSSESTQGERDLSPSIKSKKKHSDQMSIKC